MNHKKLLISVTLVAAISSCSSGNSTAATEETAATQSSASETTAVPETTVSTTTTTKAASAETTTRVTFPELDYSDYVWDVKCFVDEFKRVTDEPYITAEFEGEAHEGAGNANKLDAEVLVAQSPDRGMIVPRIYLDPHMGGVFNKYENFDIRLLEEDDNIIYLSGKKNVDPIFFSSDEQNILVLKALLKNKKVTFLLKEKSYDRSYMFEVDCGGFNKVYSSTKWLGEFDPNYFDENGIPLES